MLIGKMLAYCALDSGKEVVWIPSYGPEMRGGTAYCTVVLADRPIGSPVIKNPAHLVVMNRPSLEKFGPVIKPQGVIVVNSSLIPIKTERDDIDELRVPCNDIAIELGNAKALSMVALGAFVARSKLLDLDLLKQVVRKTFSSKPKLVDLNIDALDRGAEMAKTN